MSKYSLGDLAFYRFGEGSVDVGLVTDNSRAYWLNEKINLTFSGDNSFYTKIACKVLGYWND